MDLKIIYEDNNVLAVDKPAGIVVFAERENHGMHGQTVIDQLIKQCPDLKSAGEAPRHGIVHRLDKDTSGVLLVAKSSEALIFFQKQFKSRKVEKRYTALVSGKIAKDSGIIEAFIGRSPADPRKQKAYPLGDARLKIQDSKIKREAITEYKVLERFDAYTLLEVKPKTGRKHQIRVHLAHIHHPVAGDKVYGFKDSVTPEGLLRQFLHAAYLKVVMPNGQEKEFVSHVPEELETVLRHLPR